MNNNRREKLTQALIALDSAENYIDDALCEERDCLDNLPENLEGGERYEKMEDAIAQLEDAISHIEDVRNCVIEASV